MIDVWGVRIRPRRPNGTPGCRARQGLLHRPRRFVDEQGWPVSGFDADVFRSALAGRFLSIPRGDLARVIFDTVDGRVETRYSTSITAMREHESGIDVDLSDGSSRSFDLVVGADGLRSRVRECAFGPEEHFEHYLGYHAAAFVTMGYPHRNERTYLSFARPGRQISRYAMRDDRSAFLFVFAARASDQSRRTTWRRKRPSCERHSTATRGNVRRTWRASRPPTTSISTP